VAGFTYRKRVPLLLVFAALLVGAALYGRRAADVLVASGFENANSESARADTLLDARFGLGTPDVVVVYSHPAWQVRDPRFEQLLAPALARMARVPGVQHVGTPYGETPDALVSNDGRSVVTTVRIAGHSREEQASYDALAEHLHAEGLTTRVGGEIPSSRQAQAAAERDLVRGELITLPLIALLLVVFFRGLVVASIPLLIGGFSVAMALACLRLLAAFTDVSIFAMNIVTFVGLGVAIDYSLFITSRFRDELAAGVPVERAVRHTLETAGRTVGYSGGAVAVSLLALLVFPVMLLRSVALAGSVVVVMSLLGALIFLPALLAALGHRIEWLSLRGKQHGPTRFWTRLGQASMRAPLLVTLLVTALLITLGLPFLKINPAVAGAAVLPHDSEARHVAELMESGAFRRDQSDPLEVFASTQGDVLTPAGLASVERYVHELERLPHVTRVDAVVGSQRSAQQLALALEGPAASVLRERLARLSKGGDTAIRAYLDVPPTSEAAVAVLHAARAIEVEGIDALVTSPAARLVDLRATLAAGMPWALGLVCIATFVVLFLAFGSVVMPAKAILMNVLSLTASFGALVWIFQDGRFESLLHFESPGSIELTIPVVMFAVIFGLAMDYELFLLSRIREAYDHSGDTRQSVSVGLEKTGQIITRAALLLVAVMFGFVSADMLLVKELGVGMIVAVIVDATIVRALLVPATMQLLGRHNWWAPAPLARWWRGLSLGLDERDPAELEASEPRGVY
jgi:RND superfamily putative drug exporter